MAEKSPESEALARLRIGDSAALAELLDLQREKLERLVRLRLDARLAVRISPEDVLQETYLDAAREINRYLANPGVSFHVWLRGLVLARISNLVRDHLKAQRRAAGAEIRLPEGSSALLGMQLVAGGTSPSQQLSRKELRDRVRRAVASLEETDREVILMRHFENLSNREVAEALGLSDSGATMRYGRALCRLKEVWRRELDSEEWSR